MIKGSVSQLLEVLRKYEQDLLTPRCLVRCVACCGRCCSTRLDLVFDEPVDLPPIYTDESKVSQILRNFISNALKFTEHGEVRVSAVLTPDGQAVRLAVADTVLALPRRIKSTFLRNSSRWNTPCKNG